MGFFSNLFGGGGDQGSKKPGKAKPSASKKPGQSSAGASRGTPVPESSRQTTKVDIEKRFVLHNRIGQGSMSKVFRATDNKTGREVCLKILDKPKTEALKKRFVGLVRPDEGDIAMRLKHPNIVQTFEWGLTTKNEEYLVMEFVAGVGFNFLVETRDKILIGNELNFLIQAGKALAYFHKMGYIHRDICPRNILVSDERIVKLIDFGLAVPDTPDFRKPGNRTGTANYMAPELIRRAKTDQRIDVFSFGVTAFETFTGNLPWEQAATIESILAHVNVPGRDPREFLPDMPSELAEMLNKSIQRDPRDRYQSMREMVREMLRLNNQDPDEVDD